MVRKKKKLPLLLRFLLALSAVLMTLSIALTVTVNVLDLRSVEDGTAPEILGWHFAALRQDLAAESLYAGDLLLVRQTEYQDGMLVLCRDIADADVQADGRFALARIRAHAGSVYMLDVYMEDGTQQMVLSGSDVIGKVSYAIGFFGRIIDFVRRPVGFFSMVLGPAALLLFLLLISAVITHRRRVRERTGQEASKTEEGLTERPGPERGVLNQAVEITAEQIDLVEETADQAEAEDVPVPLEEPPALDAAGAPPESRQDTEGPGQELLEDKTQQEEDTARKPSHFPAPHAAAPDSRLAGGKPQAGEAPEQSASPDGSRAEKAAAKKEAKSVFSELTTDEIIEQFRQELEEVRLRPLEPREKEHQ